jgi:beta-glucanase (GH16 family)
MLARRPWIILFMLAALLAGNFGVQPTPTLAALPLVDDFETPLLLDAVDANNISIGWFAAQDGGTTVSFERTDSPPAPRPGGPTPNTVLQTTMNVQSFGVVIHGFTNDEGDTWVTQDWSAFLGFSLWVYGANTGTDLFLDVIDNRPVGSTRDDAERYSVAFKDDFTGWQQLQFPFDSFTRKEIGNSAPSDGFTLTEVHGWAFGALSTGGQDRTWYIDNVELYGVAPVRPLSVGFGANVTATEGETAVVSVRLSKANDAPVTVNYATSDGSATANRDYTPASGTLTFAPGVREQTFTVEILEDTKWEGNETILLTLSDVEGAEFGLARTARIDIRDNDPFDPNLIDDFERDPELYTAVGARLRSLELAADDPLALPDQSGFERVLTTLPAHELFLPIIGTSGTSPAQTQQAAPAEVAPVEISRAFAFGEDWSGATGMSLWVYGRNTGKDLTLTLRDNRAPDPGPEGWNLLWSDEFDAAAGAPPNAELWGYELGDGSVNSIPGWGNGELQYYTDSPENVVHDGQGNLVLTARDASESGLLCYYGPCEYTSARLLSQHKQEVGYGKIEARAKVPGGAGLWPAFWSLGTNIAEVSWPQTGEIDIMEFVGRVPNEIFGTIHGPGYSGGEAFGNTFTFDEPVPNEYHTYTVEWSPELIVWYVDGNEYHRATPADVAPNEWVFDSHAFFLLLNMAVGGNFGGAVSPDTVFPATMLVDYVRVYAADDTAERFEATITDDFTGWQQVTVPFSAFTRSSEQPTGAPNDGLTLSEVWGFDITYRTPDVGPLLLDQIRLEGREAPKSQMNLPVTFDDPTVSYGLVGFGGAEGSIVADPTDATNQVGRVIKSDSAELWAGVTLTDNGTRGFANRIPFSATDTAMSVRVWSPDAGIPVRLKVENAADGTQSVETEATTTVAGEWETLTFNFANHANGTAALNPATIYDKASIFFNFGTTGADAGEKTYYFDDVAFAETPKSQMDLPVTFDDPTVSYGLTGFEGATGAIVVDPTDANNTVGRVVNAVGAQPFAGVILTDDGTRGFANKVPFTETDKQITVRVWSPDAGIPLRMKIENAANGGIFVETDTTTTVAGDWETVTFDFANLASSSQPLNLSSTYDKMVIFFNFFGNGNVTNPTEKTYYFDDVTFVAETNGGGDEWSPITFDDSALTYTLTGFGGAEGTQVADPTDAANQVAQVVKSDTAELWAGVTVSTGANNTVQTIPFSASSTTMTVRVWSPDAGIPVRLKVENNADGGQSVETETTTTVAEEWETLTFNFVNNVTGTPALNVASIYNRVSIFFNFGTTGASAGEKTYYFDDVIFVAETNGGGGGDTWSLIRLGGAW